MIQSASAQRARSSSKFPMAIFSASAAVKNAAGFDFFATSNPARTILLRSPDGASGGKFGGTMSSKMHGNPRAHRTRSQHYCLFDATIHGTPFLLDLLGRFVRRDRLQNRHALVKRQADPRR